MMLITLCFRSSYLSCPLPPHALEQGWGTSSGSPTLELAPKPHDAPGWIGPLCSGASTVLPPEQGGTRGMQELWVLAAPPLPAGSRRGQAPSRWGNRAGQLESKCQEKGGPGITTPLSALVALTLLPCLGLREKKLGN